MVGVAQCKINSYLCLDKVCVRYRVEIQQSRQVDGRSHLPSKVGTFFVKMSIKEDLSGARFGRLTVLFRDNADRQNVRWMCLCDCGNKKSIRGDHLKRGETTSCGCYSREVASKRERGKTQRRYRSPEYNAWYHMIARCENPSDSRFYRYGARGIKVCERWKGEKGFLNFMNDMGARPGEKYSLDRINNDGNYEPSNCKWSTVVEQANNKSKNILVSYKGETKTLGNWTRELGLNYKNVWERMYRYGWCFEKAIKFEKRETVRHLVKYKGVVKTITQWCNDLHLKYTTVKKRLNSGWEVARAFEEPVSEKYRNKKTPTLSVKR